MKTQNQNSKRINNGMLFILGIIFSGSILLQSCSKDENFNPGSPSSTASNNERVAGDAIAIYHRGSDDGTPMPIYSVTISQLGNRDRTALVTYNGEENVAVKGAVEWKVDVNLLNAFLDIAAQQKLYDLADESKGGAETSVTKIADGQKGKGIINYASPDVEPPAALIEFQKMLETKLQIGRLVNG
ncbi:MAG: hypothetical protein ACHQNT_11470 [Bacteroidia bacterium]